jgi:hypothetical protein
MASAFCRECHSGSNANGKKPMTAQVFTPACHPHITHGGHIMLYTIAVVLIILWLLGLVTSYTIGGFIHILLVVAVIMILLRLISGRGL